MLSPEFNEEFDESDSLENDPDRVAAKYKIFGIIDEFSDDVRANETIYAHNILYSINFKTQTKIELLKFLNLSRNILKTLADISDQNFKQTFNDQIKTLLIQLEIMDMVPSQYFKIISWDKDFTDCLSNREKLQELKFNLCQLVFDQLKDDSLITIMINSLAKMYLSADQDVKLFFLSVKVENRILEMLDTCKAENKIHLLKIMDLYAIHKDHIFSIKNPSNLTTLINCFMDEKLTCAVRNKAFHHFSDILQQIINSRPSNSPEIIQYKSETMNIVEETGLLQKLGSWFCEDIKDENFDPDENHLIVYCLKLCIQFDKSLCLSFVSFLNNFLKHSLKNFDQQLFVTKYLISAVIGEFGHQENFRSQLDKQVFIKIIEKNLLSTLENAFQPSESKINHEDRCHAFEKILIKYLGILETMIKDQSFSNKLCKSPRITARLVELSKNSKLNFSHPEIIAVSTNIVDKLKCSKLC